MTRSKAITHIVNSLSIKNHGADPESFVRWGSTLTQFFVLVDEGRENLTQGLHWLPAKRQNGILLGVDDGRTLNAG